MAVGSLEIFVFRKLYGQRAYFAMRPWCNSSGEDTQRKPRLLGLQHPSKLDDLRAWNEKVIWRIAHIPGKRSE